MFLPCLSAFFCGSFLKWKMWAWGCGWSGSTVPWNLYNTHTTGNFVNMDAWRATSQHTINHQDKWSVCGTNWQEVKLDAATLDDNDVSLYYSNQVNIRHVGYEEEDPPTSRIRFGNWESYTTQLKPLCIILYVRTPHHWCPAKNSDSRMWAMR